MSAAGRRDVAVRLLKTLEALASDSGLLPEQIWDAPDLPARELFFGKASGSAMPLVWAHAEHVKLCRSLLDGRVFDLPPQPVQRYLVRRTGSPHAIWRFNHKIRAMPGGKRLRLEVLAPAVTHWGVRGWRAPRDTMTWDIGLGVHVADLETERLAPASGIDFTFYWSDAARWEGRDFSVAVG